MTNFWDFSAWGFFNLIAVLLVALMAAHMLKRSIRWLEASLIPTSVLGGGILLLISVIYNNITGQEMFDTAFFGGKQRYRMAGTDHLSYAGFGFHRFGLKDHRRQTGQAAQH